MTFCAKVGRITTSFASDSEGGSSTLCATQNLLTDLLTCLIMTLNNVHRLQNTKLINTANVV